MCNSTKDAEIRAAHESAMPGIYRAEIVDKILFGSINGKISAELATDSKPFKKIMSSTKIITYIHVIQLEESMKGMLFDRRLKEITN